MGRRRRSRRIMTASGANGRGRGCAPTRLNGYKMPAVKPEGDSEGEAEAAGDAPAVGGPGGGASPADTEHSAGSAERESSGEDPDSDDSSAMDEKECERRRAECMDTMVDLERQFSGLKEQLYRERVSQVDFQLSELRGGRSREYLGPLQSLQESMRSRIEVAGLLRQMRQENARNKFEAEELAAQQHFNSEVALAWDALQEELIEKIRKLEEDRQNVDLTWTGSKETGGRTRARRKAVTVSGPYIVYMLNDEDIMEDWTIIQKSLKRTVA